MPESPDARLAVLIDADNAQSSKIDPLLAEISKYGVGTVKRAFGDWTKPNLKGWKDILNVHAIQPIQQFSYTTGKNATDSAMIIDAMDLLYTGRFDGFCLVTSDSDFTRLASRLRESGAAVYGFGDRKTPQPLVAACDRFIYLDVLSSPNGDDTETDTGPSKRLSPAKLRSDRSLVALLRAGIDAASDDEGWAHLGGVGSNITKQKPEFDPRSWGYPRLSELVEATGLFEFDRQPSPSGRTSIIRVRESRKKKR